MRKIKINTNSSTYDIILGKDILNEINNYIKNYDKILVLTNDKVGKIYKCQILSCINHKNLFYFELPDGEEYKNLDSITKIYDFMINHDFTRKSLIISLGGGVITDMGGFVGATYMRGIDFIQIPTSLLAQVDASIGGKTGIDHKKGKNLIGAFKQPKLVLIDTNFIKTLDEKQISSGMGEIIKYSLIIYNEDKSFYEFLEKNQKLDEILEEIIFRSLNIKKYYVEKDELELGDRALLNLGHTYAHALETLFHFKNITHGEAVSKGIIFELFLSNIDKDFIDRTKKIFEKYNINPNPIYFEEDIFIKILAKDKKNSFGNINFILFDENLKIRKDKVHTEKILEIARIFKNRYVKGIIDIGTNSCRLFLAQVLDENNKISIEKELLKEVKIVKLGQDLTKNHYLLDVAITRTIDAIKNYKDLATSFGAEKLKAFATSATRDASNGDKFLKLVRDLNVPIDCIDGDMEARYNFNGNTQAFSGEILVIDIGGGSTEFAYGNKNEIKFLKSLNIGAVRCKEMFFKDEDYSKKNINKMNDWINENLKEINIENLENIKLIGVAGTLTTQVSVLEKMIKYDRDLVHKYILRKDEINKNLDLFLSKNLEDRKKIIGLEEKRSDVIIPGTIILLAILDYLNKDEIIVSESDNLNGAMINND